MKKGFNVETKEKLVGLSFVGMWLVGFLVFTAYPMLYTLYMAMNKVAIAGDKLKMEWVGFANFNKALFEDAEIPNKSIIFIQQTLIIIPIIIVFALIMSLMLNANFPFRGLIRAVFFLPVVLTSGNLIGSLTKQNQTSIPFLQSASVTKLVETIGGTWSSSLQGILGSFLIILWYSGVQMLFLIAGMQSINPSIYEAAKIDGAGKWECLWMITLPNLTPFIFISVIYTIVDQFTSPFNPLMEVITYHSKQQNTGYGYASAIAWVYFLIILAIIGASALIFKNALTTGKARKKS